MDTSSQSTLRLNSVLRGNDYIYHIEKVLGQGSFGITYLATTNVKVSGGLGNIETEIKVAVKEFFMREFNSRHEDGTITEMTDGTLARSYLKKFRKEAENLAKLSHPNIVNVLEVFDANNTCYYAMEYISGGSLDSYVKSKDGLPEKEAIECIQQIGSAVAYMHDHKMLHLDLKPANVMRKVNTNSMVLIDFGLSKQYDLNGDPESSTSIGLGTPGYAPIEQSNADREKDFAPTLDVYALGATFYKLLTGQTPPRASEVNDEGLPVDLLNQKGVSRLSIHAIELAMEPRKSKRLKSVPEFLSLLTNGEDERTDFVTISLDKTTLSLQEGSYGKLTATAPVKWSSSNPSIASVDKSGYVKAVSPGTANIIATSNGVNAICQVEVLPKPKPKSTSKPNLSIIIGCIIAFLVFCGIYFAVKPSDNELEDITLSSDSLTLEEGSFESIKASFTPSSISDTVYWTSSDTLIASVDSNGCITALKNGTVQIKARCQSIEKSCFVQVVSKQSKLTSISLNKTSLTLEEGEKTSLKVKYTPSNVTHGNPTWKSSDPKILSVTTSGTVTAVGTGNASIIVNCDGKDAYCNITVTQKSIQSKPQVVTSSSNGAIRGHEYVDLGLPSGTLWATCNVGASSPSDYGSYFAWGETTPKSSYDWENFKYDISGHGDKFSKYVASSEYGNVDNKTRLEMSDDAARANWGGSWRMPTKDEWVELRNNCTWQWTSQNGSKGYKVTSNKNNNSIFLPAAGWRSGSNLVYVGESGYYWSSSLVDLEYSIYACDCNFGSSGVYPSNWGNRYSGQSVRPVSSSAQN